VLVAAQNYPIYLAVSRFSPSLCSCPMFILQLPEQTSHGQSLQPAGQRESRDIDRVEVAYFAVSTAFWGRGRVWIVYLLFL